MKPNAPHLLLALVLVLGAAGCARVHPHLSLPHMSLGEPSFFPTIQAYTAAPIVAGNAAHVLLNGDEIFPEMIATIRGARRTITYAQYYWEEGPIGQDLAEALAERCRAGVGVNVLLDSFGTLSMPPEQAELMKRSGCHVAYFRPITRTILGTANYRLHRRILVVDGRVGFTGGSGISKKWMGNGRMKDHWRDTDVRVDGPAVEYLQGAFAENWLEATGVVLGGEAYFPRPVEPRGGIYAQVVRSSPAAGKFAIYTTLLLAMSSARRSIYITNPYLVLDDAMSDALLNARQRGARVVILVPGEIDHNIVRQASRAQFGRMLRGGVEIHEYRAALLHAKTMVMDGAWSTVGSTNLDNRSFALNEELNVVFYSAPVARRLEQVFLSDLQHAHQVSYREWRSRSFTDRVLELLARPFRSQL